MAKRETRSGIRSCSRWRARAAVLWTAAALATTLPADASSTAGLPVIRNYHHQEFGAEIQNWDVVQADSGLVYFANNAGILEYDGRAWRLIELPSSLAVYTLVLDPATGRIYVGAGGDFGYLGPDNAGQLRFNSLLPPNARSDEGFDQVFTPVVTSSGVYFSGKGRLCEYAGGRLSCRQTDGLSRIFAAGDTAYVQRDTGPLMQSVHGTLHPIADGDRLAGREITLLLSIPGPAGDRLLVGTRQADLLVYEEMQFRPFLQPGQSIAGVGELLDAALLDDGSVAVATSAGGLLIIGPDGVITRRVDRRSGLPDNHVHGVWPDREGGLWLALQTGISRVELDSAFTRFGEESGLEREWRELVRFGDTVYVRGYRGLFTATLPGDGEVQPSATLRFHRVAEIDPPVWDIVVIGDRVLVTSKDGVFETTGGRRFRRVVTAPSLPMWLFQSITDPARVYVGLAEGLMSLRLERGAWRNEGRIAGIDETITSLAEDRAGRVWIVSQRQRVMRLDPPGPGGDFASASGRLHAFDRNTFVGRTHAAMFGGRPVFLSESGIFEYDEKAGTFVPVAALDPLVMAGRRSFHWLVEDRTGSVWVASRKPGVVDVLRRRLDGTYAFDGPRLFAFPVWSIYPEPQSDVVWLPTPDHLLRYDPAGQSRAPAPFSALIRRVAVNGERTLFGGAGPVSAGDGGPLLPFRDNSLHFEYAAPRFKDAERNEYQTLLEGFDQTWSSWSQDSYRTYTNLPEGKYRFRVRARDIQGIVGSEASYAFAISPPWYRSGLAWMLYGLGLIGLAAGLWRLHLRRAHQRLQQGLESMELEKLRELDAMKSRFFADISHEFRTPLTLILGPVEQLLQGDASPEDKGRLHLIRRNAEYLLRLISQLLDLAKLESGRLRLQAAPDDLAAAVNAIVAPFVPLAEREGLRLACEILDGPRVEAPIDRAVLQKILNNLLANAIKFTPAGGTITVTVSSSPRLRPGEALDENFVEVCVADTGVGIPREQQPRVFDRFFQGEAGRSREGIGIGLAVVKDLVELHRGSVIVDSEPGRGTAFFVRLPKDPKRFGPGEIVEQPPSLVEPPSPWLHVADTQSRPQAEARAARDADDAETVLVVEDHPEMRRLVRDYLEPTYRVLEATDGHAALELAVAAVPDLVVSDVMMQPMDGYALCRALKSHEATCHIPVVLLTARAAREDRMEGLTTGADCYLVKPVDASELLVHVRNLIEQRRLLRQRFSSAVILKPSDMAVTPIDRAFLERVLAVVQDHIADPEFDVERLGREVGLSRSQLHRKLRALTNQPPTLLIRSIRLYRAAELLRQRAGSVAEIAYAVGFSSQTYFAKCFREQFGCTPKEYVQRPTDVPPPSGLPPTFAGLPISPTRQ